MRSHEIRNQELRARKRNSAHQRSRQHWPKRFPSTHHQHQICWDDEREWCADSPHLRAQAIQRQSGDAGQRNHRDRDGSESNGRRVGEQANGGGVERRESETREHGAGHRHRSSEPRCAFHKSAERERDQQRLQPAIIGQAADGMLDGFKLARVQREPIEKDRPDYDPSNGKQPERGAIGGRA